VRKDPLNRTDGVLYKVHAGDAKETMQSTVGSQHLASIATAPNNQMGDASLK